MLKINKLTLHSPQMMSLQNIDMDIELGKVYSIVGQRKEGQETLALLLANVLEPAMGSVVLDGINTGEMTRRTYAKYVSVLQPTYDFNPDETVLENLKKYLVTRKSPVVKDKSRILKMLQYVHIDTKRASTLVSKLSEKERYRLRLVKLFLDPTPILCFLTSPKELSYFGSETIMHQLIQTLDKEKHALIFLSENAYYLPATDELWGIHRGNLLFIREN